MIERYFTLARSARILDVPEARLAEVVKSGLPMRHTTDDGEAAWDFDALVLLRRCPLILRGTLTGPQLEAALLMQVAAMPRKRGAEVIELPILGDRERAAVEHAKGRRAEASEDVRVAERHYRRALDLDRTCAPAWTGLGRLLADAGYPDEALQCLARSATLAPEAPEPPFRMGAIHALRGDPISAVAALSVATGLDPDNADAHSLLAGSLRQLGEIERARAHATRALELAPDAPWARELRAALATGKHEVS